MRKHIAIVGSAASLLVASNTFAAVIAGPVVNPSNNHTYFLLDTSSAIEAQAEALTMNGNLVTVDDEAENTFLVQNFLEFGGIQRQLWLGLNDVNIEATFTWFSGDAVAYTNFAAGEPNGLPDNNQDYVAMFSPSRPFALGSWNDTFPDALDDGQFPTFGVVEVVPEPTSAAMTAIVAGALMRRRNRK